MFSTITSNFTNEKNVSKIESFTRINNFQVGDKLSAVKYYCEIYKRFVTILFMCVLYQI